MKVPLKIVERIMNDVCECRDIHPDTLEYATDIEHDDEYIVRAYDPEYNCSYLVIITKQKKNYAYSLIIRPGEKLEY